MTFGGRAGDIRLWVPWLLGIIISVLLVVAVKQAVKWYSIQEQVKSYEQDLTSAEVRHQELQELLKYVQMPNYTEEQARLKFGLAKPGERLVIVPENFTSLSSNAENQPSEANGQQEILSRKPNYQKWWFYFFNK